MLIYLFAIVGLGCGMWALIVQHSQEIGIFKLWHWRRFWRAPMEIKPVHPKGNQP